MTTKATPRPVGFAAPPHRFAVSAERTHGSITAPADESVRLGAGFRKPVPTLLLEHRSRKSGKNFVAPLLYITDRNNVIVVASALGQAENPQWYRNLPPNPDTHIQIGSDRRPVRAVVASSDERARLWPRPVDAYADFDSCQSWTERGIPVIILRPR